MGKRMNAVEHLNYLTVYRSPDRDAFVAGIRDDPPFFEATTGAWIVAQPELCTQLLKSPHLQPAPSIENYSQLSEAVGIDFASIGFAYDSIPLCMHGERHTASRQQMSVFLVQRREALRGWIEEGLAGHLAPLARPGRVDVLREVVKPLTVAMFESIVGVDLPDTLNLEDISLVFDKAISMRRRQRLEADMAALIEHVRDRLGPGAEESDVRTRLALAVVGKDSVVGTLSESLMALFRDADGRRLSEIDYPRQPHGTAVPFVERIVLTAFSAGGRHFAAGDRVRIVLQTYAFEPAEQHHRLFGAGAHACLGRPASTEVWSAVCRELSRIPMRVRLAAYALAAHSYVFNVPRQFEVEISE